MPTHPSQSYNHLLACNHYISVPCELIIYQAEEAAAEKTICSNQELVTSFSTKGHTCIVVRSENASWKALVEWLPAKMHGKHSCRQNIEAYNVKHKGNSFLSLQCQTRSSKLSQETHKLCLFALCGTAACTTQHQAVQVQPRGKIR